ncbi:MAG: MlaE family ABC transporter permease [Oligoflexales bacterium]
MGSHALPELTPLRNWLPVFGDRIIKIVRDFGAFLMYGKETFVLVFKPPFRTRLVLHQMEFIGNESLFIIMISGFFLGAVFSLQIGSIFAIFGAQGMVGAASGKALSRELSPLVTGFLLAGRGGAAITAELATMKVTEQIDAMEAMAVDPIHYLVVPRVIATICMMPLLVGVFNFTGQIGSLVVSFFMFDVDQGVYFDKLIRIVEIGDIWRGMQKALVFGAIISLLSCRAGLTASGGAKGVGMATTNSVVMTLLVLLAVDFIITYFQIVV